MDNIKGLYAYHFMCDHISPYRDIYLKTVLLLSYKNVNETRQSQRAESKAQRAIFKVHQIYFT